MWISMWMGTLFNPLERTMCKIAPIEGSLIGGVFNGERSTVRMTVQHSCLDAALEVLTQA